MNVEENPWLSDPASLCATKIPSYYQSLNNTLEHEIKILETIFLSRQVLFELKINELKIEKKRSHVAMLLSRRGKIGKIFKC